MKTKKIITEIIMLWLLPLTLIISYAQWQSILPNQEPVIWYHLVVPAIAMTLLVSLGAGVLKMWRFEMFFGINGVPPQIGIVYAAVLQLVFLVNIDMLTAISWTSFLIYPLATALLGMLGGVAYDLIVVHFGILQVGKRSLREHAGTFKIVASYGFYFFGTVGLLAGISSKIGYYLIQNSVLSIVLVYAVGCLIIFLPIAAYLVMKFQVRSRFKREVV